MIYIIYKIVETVDVCQWKDCKWLEVKMVVYLWAVCFVLPHRELGTMPLSYEHLLWKTLQAQ